MCNEREKLYLELYRTHQRQLHNYIFRRIQNYHDAEDLTEEVFLYLHQRLSQFDESKAPLAAYLFIIAKSRLKNYYRDRKKVISFDESFMAFEPTDDFDYIGEATKLMDDRQAVYDLLMQLNVKERTIIVLRYFGNYRPEEIAIAMGLSTGNVRVILSRSIAKMRKRLKTEESMILVDTDEQ